MFRIELQTPCLGQVMVGHFQGIVVTLSEQVHGLLEEERVTSV